jgi:DNA-binding transcriptional MerR regulator
MEPHKPNSELPPIPAKRYFTIGEVSELCGVKAHVLRYWEQEFAQLNPVKRSGNRRYYQHHEVVLIRRIRELLYEQGFTISGARNRLDGARVTNNPPEVVLMAESEKIDSSTEQSVVMNRDTAALKREIRDIIAMLNG